MIRRLLCAAAVAGIPAALAAQAPGAVHGRVVDGRSGAPLSMARVTMGAASVSTGSDGRFVLDRLDAGVGTLLATAIGYAPARAVVEVIPGVDEDRTIRLTPMVVTLPELRVDGSSGEAVALDHDALVRRGADLASALDGWEGIVVRRSGGNGPASPQVRGSAPEEVVVLVDGFAINDPLTGRADLSRVPSRDVGSVRVLPGAQSAGGAGSAVGGVISIRSRSAPGGEASGWVGSYGSAEATVAAAAASIHLFARGARLPDDYPYHVPSNRGGGEALRQNAGGTTGEVSLRRSGTVSVLARASASRRGIPGSVGNESPTAQAEDRVGFLGVTVAGRSTIAASLQYLRTDASDASPSAGPSYDVRTEGVSGTFDWTLARAVSAAGWGGSLELGASARHDRFGGEVVAGNARFTRGGVRATATIHPAGASPWTLTPALRLDLWTGAAHPVASARLDAGWKHDRTSLRASAGSAVTAPALADLFFREGVGVALNPGLRPERVRWELEVGVEQEWWALGGPATATLRAYAGRVDGMILWAPGAGFIWSPRNYDVVRRGIEAGMTLHPRPGWTIVARGAWSPVTYAVPGGAQVQYRPVGTAGASAAWAGRAWGLDARWKWVGQRYPNPGGVNARPAYGVLDAGAQRTIGRTLIRADIRDILDARAEFLAGYPTPGRTAVLSISLEWQ